MKRKLDIQINSRRGSVEVAILGNGSRRKWKRFPTIDEAFNYAFPLGNRETELMLNGYNCTLAGWWDPKLSLSRASA